MIIGGGVSFHGGISIDSILADGVANAIAPVIAEETYTITPFTPIQAIDGTGTGPYTYIITAGTLPAGLALNPASGAVSGTTTTAQPVSSATFAVQDVNGYISPTTSTVNITVLPRITATAVITSLRAEVTRTITGFQPLIAANGNGVYTYSVSPALPAGLSLNPSTGVVSGTPTAAASQTSYTFSVRDSLGITATTTSAINITVYSLITATATVPPQTIYAAVAITPIRPLLATGGTGTYTYALAAGSVLPTGLSLNPTTGYISGTTSQANYGTVVVTIYVRDDLGVTASTTAALSIYVYVYITANRVDLVDINSTVNIPISPTTPIRAANGLPPYGYYFTGPPLPTGLTYNTSTGVLSGTPTTTVAGTFTFIAVDSLNNTAATTVAFGITINALMTANTPGGTVVPQELEVGTAMTPYIPLSRVSGGTPPYTYYLASYVFPAGINIDPTTGVISGTPTTTYGPSTVDIGLRDSVGSVSANIATVYFRVYPRITASGPDTGVQNLEVGLASANFIPIVASYGTGIYTYSSSVNLTAYGLTFNSATGMVSGTPTSPFSGTVLFTVRDSLGVQAAKVGSHTYNIYARITATADTTAKSYLIANAITAYNPLTATNGSGVYTYSYTGTLPTGLTYNTSTGVLSGTPTARQTTSATFSVKDSLNVVAPTTSTVSFYTGYGPVTIDYLVVAGGGGGGMSGPSGTRAGGGGGGGGGGYVSGSYVQNPGTVLTITVGGGGTAGSPGAGGNGTTSTLTFATSATGGGGGAGWTPSLLTSSGAGRPGGSGGGGTPTSVPSAPGITGGYAPNGGGAGSQGNPGGSSGASPGGAPFPNQATGGGGGGGGGSGGAGGAGAIGPSPTFNVTWTGLGGPGGPGRLWPFTGATLYAGGGGGGGGIYLTPAPSGTSNYGGGGTGGSSTTGGTAPGASGGGGVVVLSMPTVLYSGIKTGGTASNPPAAPGRTVITYSSSGNYTV